MRRRRTKWQWFRNTGTPGEQGVDVEDTSAGVEFANNVAANGTSLAIAPIPLLFDLPSEELVPGNNSMGAYTQNDYLIKRIVGKVFATRVQVQVATDSAGILFAAGIFIARAEDLDSSGGNAQPIGSGSAAQTVDNYSPLRAENIQEPWIWRRTWILSNVLSTGAGAAIGAGVFPRSTAEYGSVADGPHVDAKTGRRVRDGERLWFVTAARNWPLNNTAGTPSVSSLIQGHFDYRILGAPRRNKKRSVF